MRRVILAIFACICCIVCSAQDNVLSKILGATILESRESFDMKSVASGTYTVYAKILITKESGAREGNIVIFADKDKSLVSFSGSICDVSGKVLKKLKKQDLQSRALATELADDSYAYFYQPIAPYPYIVEYEYTLNYKRGVSSFPSYIPVTRPDVSLSMGRYSISVPSGTRIQYSSPIEPEKSSEGGKDTYTWNIGHFGGFVSESMMPRRLSLVPYVYATPINFMYSKVSGTQGSWKEIGSWLYELQSECRDLSSAQIDALRSLTEGCATTYDKVKVLYDYLRKNTRYISIQLGIGGYQPFPASLVAKTGFGDCKGLSNLMKTMLAAVGVESDYFILNTNRKDLEKDYSSVGSMNHAMLAVPLKDGGVMQGDTLWVECTNPVIPLGYRHEDVAGHQVLLIKSGGGEFVRCSGYPDSLSRLENRVKVLVSSAGEATVNVCQTAYLDLMESRLSLYEMDDKDKSDALAKEIIVSSNNPKVNSISNNFSDYPKFGKAFVPWIRTDYSFESKNFAESNADRLFIPLTPLRRGVHWQRGERKNDIFIETGTTYLDSIEIYVPVTYECEGLPKTVNVDCAFASFSSSVKADGGKVTVFMKVVLKAGSYPKESYAEYKAAARKFDNMCSSKIVFRRKQ
ncbi:MAG: transglutaminase family protein [Bacteroidales bacterium]|nr:transglutaminase family protein [Bacteroidales bacterium]